MLRTSLVNNTEELQQILQLQKENLIQHLAEDESRSQGFVTMHHSPEILLRMHEMAPSVIIKDNERLVAYALTMLKECRDLVPALQSMFDLFDILSWKNKPLNSYRYYVMGQICVAKQYRGKGLVNELYRYHKDIYSPKFDLFLTEIATRNHRSLKAHQTAGFQTIHIYRDHLDEWAVVGWDWS